ncbi:hypothetical protein M3Y99_01391600 [Aphelenchoides fujianensis]|nr:hypothetical protein M3Y99_01391600 [Aphelenchoides fujianensis]
METIRVLYARAYPLVSPFCAHFPPLHASPYCRYPGILVEILRLLADEAALRIEPLVWADFLHAARDSRFFSCINTSGRCVDGALYEQLEAGVFDLVADVEWRTAELAERFDLSAPLYFAESRVLKKEKTAHFDRLWSFFDILDARLWAGIGAAWALQCAVVLLVRRVESTIAGGRRESLVDVRHPLVLFVHSTAWKFVRVQLMQQEELAFRLRAGRLVLSFILASLFRPTSAGRSIQDVLRHLETGEYSLVTTNAEALAAMLNSSRMFPFGALRSALAANPPLEATTGEDGGVSEALRLVEGGRFLLLQTFDDPTFAPSNGRCGLTRMDGEMPLFPKHLLLRKGHPLTRRLNRAIEANRERIRHVVRKYSNHIQHQNNCTNRREKQPLKMTPYAGLLAACSILIAVAGVSFVAEVLNRKRTDG